MVRPLDPAGSTAPAALPLKKPVRPRGDAKLHAAAKQFEAMFMTEMLHHARPQSKAAGVFAPSAAERSWQVFMDQALGQAAVAGDRSGLSQQIEKALRAAQGQAGQPQAAQVQPNDGPPTQGPSTKLPAAHGPATSLPPHRSPPNKGSQP